MPTVTNLYSMKEAAQHNTREDCWVIIDGKVYDVTDYLFEHPGGDDVLLSATGRDSTEEFEDAGHGSDARNLMKDYLIGEVDPSSIIPKLTIDEKEQPTNLSNGLLVERMQCWALPVSAIAMAVLAAGLFYTRSR